MYFIYIYIYVYILIYRYNLCTYRELLILLPVFPIRNRLCKQPWRAHPFFLSGCDMVCLSAKKGTCSSRTLSTTRSRYPVSDPL